MHIYFLKWLSAESGVETCKRAVYTLEICRIQSKPKPKFYVKKSKGLRSLRNLHCEAKESAPEARRQMSKVKIKTEAPQKKQKQALLLSLFILFRLQVYSLVPLTLRMGLSSSVTLFSHTQNSAKQLGISYTSWHNSYHYNNLLNNCKENKI